MSTEETLIAGKYESEEDLHKGVINKITQDYGSVEDFYKNLEKGSVKVGESKPSTESKPSAMTIEQDEVSMDTMKSEILSNGEASEKTRSALVSQFGEENVKMFEEAVVDKKSASEQSLYEIAGGKEKYQELAQWAKDNMSSEDLKGYNDAITSKNGYIQKSALQALVNSYNEAEGTGGQRISGDLGGEKGTPKGAYNNYREMITEMKDPKYQTDPKFREEVMAKAKRSNL